MIKEMFILALSFCVAVNCSTVKGQNNEKIIQNFFHDLYAKNIDDLARSYILNSDTATVSNGLKEYLQIQITFIKNRIKEENLDDLTIEPLNNVSSFKIPEQALLKDIYTVKCGQKIVCSNIWIVSAKIRSLSSFTKGGDKKYFFLISPGG